MVLAHALLGGLPEVRRAAVRIEEAEDTIVCSRTDSLKATIVAELEHRRAELDGDACLRRVEVVVLLKENGQARAVLYRTEAERCVERV